MSTPLRIAMFVGCFPVVSETFILRQITGLLDLGHTVDIYADTRGEAGQPRHQEIDRYRLLDRTVWMEMPPEVAPHEMPVWPLTGRTWPPGSPTSIHNLERVALALPVFLRCLWRAPRLAFQVLRSSEYSYRAASLSGLYRLARCAERNVSYDVLHAQFGPVGNSFRFTRELWQAPLVVSFHGYDFCTLPRREGEGMYAKLFATADLVTVNSQYTRARLEQLGCPASRLRLLPVGLDPAAFPFRERHLKPGEPVRILTVGRLVEIKGHEYLLRAMARVRQRFPEAHCDVVGEGPLRRRLTGLIGELGLQANVTLHGALAGQAVKDLMERAHLFVLPSVNVAGDAEGQGLVLQEAQACGLPVVATRHGALPEGLVEGQSGFLVPERDETALAERLVFTMKHPDQWPALGRAGREFVAEHYDIRNLNRRLVELYAEARDLRLGRSRRVTAAATIQHCPS